MAKRRRGKQRKGRQSPLEAPLLSHVEFQAVLIWLDWQIAMTTRELEVWRSAAKMAHNQQTLGSVVYHRNALTALERCRATTYDLMQRRLANGLLPPAVQSCLEVIERN